jgi:hypothetical protein
VLLCIVLSSCSAVDTYETKQNKVTSTTTTVLPVEASITTNANQSDQSDVTKTIKVGDYVQFGKYYGDPILWKCVKKEGRNPVLVSEYILCLKAFDAAESGIAGEGNDGVQKYGSNKWHNSNIREWLNAIGKVSYTTQPPIKMAVLTNAYADEPGFLSDFSSNERDFIKSVKHDGVSDKIYLLSDEELVLLGGKAKEATKKAIQNSSYRDLDFSIGVGFWTRTPTTSYPYNVHIVPGDLAYIGGSVTYGGTVGILPALNLKSDIYKSGKGTRIAPYKQL